MWGADKQNGEMANCISSLAANVSVTSQASLLLGREDGLSWYCILLILLFSV
ncbi:myocyte-specific enhancer factor 2D isoform X1, partial [Tachysurus ichikawai]